MLEQAAPSIGTKMHNPLFRTLRLVLGYIAAVAVGAILFAALLPWTSSTGGLGGHFVELAVICFVLGLICAAPYTIVACFALKFLLPRNWPAFMSVGALCPTVTILTAQLLIGGKAWPTEETLKILLATIPTGLLSAWVFGAVGLGRWRFAR